MSKFLAHIVRGVFELISNAIIDLIYAVICAAEVVLCLWIGYSWLFAPMAAAPGSRDGAGLLIVGPIILGLSLLPAIVMISGTRSVFRSFFPNWRPISFD